MEGYLHIVNGLNKDAQIRQSLDFKTPSRKNSKISQKFDILSQKDNFDFRTQKCTRGNSPKYSKDPNALTFIQALTQMGDLGIDISPFRSQLRQVQPRIGPALKMNELDEAMGGLTPTLVMNSDSDMNDTPTKPERSNNHQLRTSQFLDVQGSSSRGNSSFRLNSVLLETKITNKDERQSLSPSQSTPLSTADKLIFNIVDIHYLLNILRH